MLPDFSSQQRLPIFKVDNLQIAMEALRKKVHDISLSEMG